MILLPLAAASLLGVSAQAQPPIRTETQAVEIDVRVTDRDGRFVTSLTKADFEVLEEGAPQDVIGVYLVTGGTVTVPGATRATPPVQVQPPAPETVRQTWIFVFDSTHLTPGSLDRTRDAVLRFVRERFQDGDMAGVVSGGRMLNNRLTSVRAELEQAVASITMPGGLRSRLMDLREWPRFRDEREAIQVANEDRETIANIVRRACEDDPSSCKRVDPEMIVRSKARKMTDDIRADTADSLTTVAALASGLARIPGPKAVVFISEGFVVDRVEDQLRVAVGQAARSGARFYTIDARGLNRGSTAGIIDQPLADRPSGGGPQFDLQSDGTTSLAVDTGGIAIRNENDFGRALDLIARDGGSFYVVGYRPTNPAWDGKYRRVEVRVRPPGLKVRARRGYVALEPAKLLRPVPATVPAAPHASSEGPAPEGDRPIPPALAAAAAAPIPPVPPRSRANIIEMVSRLSRGTASDSGDPAAEGWAAYQRGDLASAADHLRRAAARPGAKPWVSYALGFALLSQSAGSDAVREWERVRSAVPEFEPVYYDLADLYTQLGDERMALLVLRDAERQWPSDPDLFNAMGVIQLRRGALDDAIDSFERAVKVAPEDALGYFNLGRTYQIRYARTQRFVPAIGQVVRNEDDRKRAIASLEKYLALGGPYATQARDALSALSWK